MIEQICLDINYPILKNHKVYGQELLPGLAYIDMLYQIFRENGYDYATLELRNLSIYNPLIVEQDYNVILSVQCSENKEGQWQIRVEGQKQHNGTLAPEKTLYVTAEMHQRGPVLFEETLDLNEIKNAAKQIINLDDIYEQYRRQELIHTGFMKAAGRIYDGDTAVFIDVSLGQKALPSAASFMFHPTLIDGSGIGAGVLLSSLHKEEQRLFLPLFYESFCAAALFQEQCVTRLQISSVQRNKELIHMTMEFFNGAGQKIGELRNFTGKLVRDAGLINPHRKKNQQIVTETKAAELSAAFVNTSFNDVTANNTVPADEAAAFLRHLLAERLKKTADQIETQVGYYELGLDSPGLLGIVQAIQAKINAPLSPTLLFEYTTIAELSAYLTENYASKFAQSAPVTKEVEQSAVHMGTLDSSPTQIQNIPLTPISPNEAMEHVFSRSNSRNYSVPAPSAVEDDIAIIGMAGRYPKAKNLQEFWINLQAGIDCITEIPQSRWDWQRLSGLKSPSGKDMSRWGGFLDDPDCFDAKFFRISPREAETTDPQERMFLEACWEAMEDAGYTPKTLVAPQGRNKRRHVGVFVGVMHKDYTLVGAEALSRGQVFPLSLNYAPIANRVSYFCNFHGPSMAIDTLCSSSLTAVHLAIESIRKGESEVALAGGVNLSFHPHKYLTYGMMDMHSSDGYCHTFGKGGDGYVSGEGVGVVLLKPLSKAIQSQDNIYAVIKGSTINHGGTVSGITVPNPVAQADVIVECLEKTGIDPRTISYIEAHGTGTSLGDPIEIEGLVKAFRHYTPDRQFCSIGSVKSNIGHTESAAGISGLHKIALQLHYKTVVPSLHSEELNPYIDFAQSPFYTQRKTAAWKQPMMLVDGYNVNYPRRAGLSSFGAYGSNAHIILEEYLPEKTKQQGPVILNTKDRAVIIPLSAKNEEQLQAYAGKLLEFLKGLSVAEISGGNEEEDLEVHSLHYSKNLLADMAYTLQVGREAMENRAAFLVKDIPELMGKLAAFSEGKEAIENCWRGQVKHGKEFLDFFSADQDSWEIIHKWIKKGNVRKIAELWINGLALDWELFYRETKPRRISLPTYPFDRERYWIPENATKSHSTASSTAVACIHPLLHQNTSDLSEQRFSSIFTGGEFFLADHVVKGQRVLPGVACLEMARAAVAQAAGVMGESQRGIRLRNVVWTQPVIVGEQPAQVHIGLFPEENGDIVYEIYSGDIAAGAEHVIHSRGSAVLSTIDEVPTLDLEALQAQCNQKVLSSGPCYETFRGIGVDYGSGYQGLEKVYAGSGQVLAKLSLPSTVFTTQEQFVLHPSLLEAALQASLGLVTGSGDLKPSMPFALQELEIFGKCSPVMWALVCYSDGSKPGDKVQRLNVDLCDKQGHVCIRMKGLEIQESTEMVLLSPTEPKTQSAPALKTQEAFEIMTFEEVWQEQVLPDTSPVKIKNMVCFLSDRQNQQAIVEAIQTHDQQTRIIFIAQSTAYHEQSPQEYRISRSDGNSYREAFQSIREEYGEVDAILYLWALEDAGCVQDYTSIVYILQAIAAVKLKASRCLLAGQFADGLERCYLESWIGFERSLGLVLPTTQVTAILQGTGKQDPETAMKDWMQKLWAELQVHKAPSVLYQERKRYVYKVQPTTIQPGDGLIRAGGTYLITGGCGGLGFLFAEYFAKKHRVNLILTGRSPISAEKQAKIEALEDLGGQVLYVQADVCDPIGMKEGLNRAKERFGGIHGVIHAAGIEGNQSILEKDIPSFTQVLEPKIRGTLILDALLQEEVLDFICYFSSSAAILGDFGSCDYAIGNRFLMAYAHYRKEEQSQAKAFSINWPLWKDGGMGLGNDENNKMYLKSSGQQFLEAEEGLAMFDHILSQNNVQHLVMAGQPSRVHRFLGLLEARAIPVTSSSSTPSGKGRRAEMKGLSLQQCLEWDLKEHVSNLLKTPRDSIDGEENLADFGFDSISLTEFATLLTNYYGVEITPTLFFGYSTLERLSQYFLTEHQVAIQEFYQEGAPAETFPQRVQVVAAAPKRQEPKKSRFIVRGTPQSVPEPIAIIGMSGRFPQADTVDELWKNLIEGKNCITEIPSDRWKWWEYFGDPHKEMATVKSKWGGFLSDIDRFDPLFFEISPREAEFMDPRQRFILEDAWHAFEDAGYMGERIRGMSCGVYIGVEEGEYGFLTGSNGHVNSNQNATLAARIAYTLDLKGPNLALTAACSSGLVAIHEACQALRQGECEMAIAGGISLMISPLAYIGLSKFDMLSPDGKCCVFDQRANGLVPSEASAVVLLKPLSKAILDKDQIYGCIKASGVNYNGKSNGITAPNLVSQAELIKNIYDKYHIDPAEVQYILSHSVGSKLGDPIEIQALSSVFGQFTDKKQYCNLGSIKPLVGHTFAVSGIVNLISMLLAMKHRTIPALHNYESENEYVNFAESPFMPSIENQIWATHDNKPRIGAISTTGISGTNAHAVIEEYLPRTAYAGTTISIDNHNPLLFVLSAKNIEQLRIYAKNMKRFIEIHAELDLTNMAYTLQIGRVAMDYRLAILANSREVLLQALEEYIENNSSAKVLTSQVKKHRDGIVIFEADEDAKALLQTFIQKRKFKEILELWVNGLKIDWNRLYDNSEARRISLPTYPFADERYWVSETDTGIGGCTKKSVMAASIHPLLQQNISDFSEQRFSSNFTGREFFLADHVVQGQRVLPGVAYLEMARAAVAQATGAVKDYASIRLKNVVWARPVVVGDQPVRILIRLFPEDNGEISYEIFREPENGDTIVHSQGGAVLSPMTEIPILDLKDLQAQCGQILSSDQCYEAFKTMGIEYGPGHKGIETMYVGTGQVLARLSLPSSVSDTQDQFILHPSLMDSALQASIGLMMDADGTMPFNSIAPLSLRLPFALQGIEVFGKCTPKMWAFIRYSDNSNAKQKIQKLHIDVCDDQGNICIRMEGFSTRVVEGEIGLNGTPERHLLADSETCLADVLIKESQTEIQHIPSRIAETKPVPASRQDSLREKATNYFKGLLASVFKLPLHRIEADAPLEKYGINSSMVLQLTNQLEKTFGSLSKTLFFEYQNIQELTDYFLEAYRDQVIELVDHEEKTVAITRDAKNSFAITQPVKLVNHRRSRFALLDSDFQAGNKRGTLDIAIIGVSGRYPGAKNIQEFWKNLRDAKDCVTEIPQSRWDHSLYFDEDKEQLGKTYSKWGGFLEGVDQFDPLFFNISPREAKLMDPQERLFLECVYETLEDAGYTREVLGQCQDFDTAGNVGVYVGVMYEEYQLYGAQEQIQGRPVAIGGNLASIANRISYYCNFHGPSMAVETMCSSSLAAIHLACQSIHRGECGLAIAGGVNVSIHPNKYLRLGQNNFLSSKGRCESFGQGGDGYVPGEGVGAVLLKPLSQAVADRDHIYGIIKATAINHGGKTNGYTVPNPKAQASVIGRALKDARIAPRTVSYLEAHGTGTVLGDPIEITGLTRAFEQDTKAKQFCSIGSAKSNIGHCESAAGIAGVTKVLLQLKYRQLVPSLHSKTLNPNIDFTNTPFVVQQELTEWKRPVVAINGETREYPRIAGISSFGAGGLNAHVVIEEYISKNLDQPSISITSQNPAVIILSAKNETQLQEKVQRLLAAIQEQQFSDTHLADIAYTLQIGREAMEERLAMLVGSVNELEEKLKGFVEGRDGIADIYRGQVKRNKETLAVFTADEDLQQAIDTWVTKGKYVKLLDFWVKGLIVDWNKLYGESKPRRISLPTYPFAREGYWVPQIDTKISNTTTSQFFGAAIHPLLQQNTSDLSEQRFTSTFTGQEFFLADHVVKGQRMLPGVAYLEMARAAVEQAAGTLKGGQKGIRLKNIVWTKPITTGEQPVQVHIGIYPEDNGDIAYEIYSEPPTDNAEPVIHSQGSAVLGTVAEVSTLDLPALQAQCSQNIFSATQCYETFRTVGLDYGPGHQGILEVYVGRGQVLAKLALPSVVSDTKTQFILHPSIIDAALQASFMISAGDVKLALPFALQELEIIRECTSAMWALIRYSEGSKPGGKVQKLDINLCDDQGHVCVRMKGFSSRMLEGEADSLGTAEAYGTLMLQPSWEEQHAAQEATVPTYEQHLVLLCEPNIISQEIIETKMAGARCLILQTQRENIEERFRTYAVQAFEEIQRILKERPKDKVLVQIVIPTPGERQLFSGLSGLLRTAQLENPKFIGQLIEVEPGEEIEGIVEKLQENSRNPIDNYIRYQDRKRYVAGWSEVKASPKVGIPWKDRGGYLITGGAGGLGYIFAREIMHKVKDATLILTGRSPLNASKQAQFKELEALGGRIEYKQVDVTQKQAVADLIQDIQANFGNLHGIIHSAGVIKDNFVLKKTKEELQAVLAPKVAGLVNLDEASKDLPLDFFILFSSISGGLGNPGQSDYSTANAFMDAYARYRNSLVAAEQRHGQTLSINWPLWKEGGMRVDQDTERTMLQNTGMIAMQTPTGIQALYQSLASGENQVMVVEGDVKRLYATILQQPFDIKAAKGPSVIEENDAVSAIEEDILREKAEHYFKKLLSSVIKLSANRIEVDAPLEKYGIDSVMVMQLTNQLEKIFGSLSKTLLFEYQNIKDLTEYFLEAYRDQLTELLGIEEKVAVASDNSQEIISAAAPVKSVASSCGRPRFASLRIENPQEKSGIVDIAVIGVSGRYPQAKNIREFWKNLQDGRDCITEIPKERWDHSLYFDEDKNKPGKTYSKWGGFLDGVDQFDPLFFNISPREAEVIDPQERLFLQCVYEAMEDAGYTRETLGSQQSLGLEGNVGVYVGVMYEEYQLYGAQQQIQGRPVALAGNPSSIANRVSYFCNFHGPSMAVETMCSSSLTAIHLACQSLQRGGCELAIAGGVNVSIHPNKYLILGQNKFVSSKGRCESFGQGGDGYVPGEGVGAVLLKPLANAIADGDHIYGVIKATAVNHGGKTNGYTVPNPNAQASVIGRAFREAGIDPRAISYIEAHGTGTSLGDPIEIAGLTKTFQEYTKDKQFCAIGSAKSNIGHCESAAGIAGVTKVLLQLKHRQLAPSLHSEVLNPHIDFGNTPFVVQQELAEWKRPVITINGENREYPRIAGISSFGAGGSNAHVVIEEYIPEAQERPQIAITTENPAIIILSAKNEERLKEQAQQLLAVIKEQQLSDTHLSNLAYTLQVGREAMEERLAVIAGSIIELEEKLTGFVEGRDDIEDFYRGQVKRNKETLAIFAADEEMQEAIVKWVQRRKYAKLLDFWVKGLIFDWNNLYGASKPRRISLPTYPFAKERYWVPRIDADSACSVIETSTIIGPIHPLLHQNTSDFSEQRFTSTFTGQEFFLADHIVKGQRVLPGVAYLEMARAAVKKAAGAMEESCIGIRLKNVIWAKPIVIADQPVQVHIGLYPEDNGEIAYEIYSSQEDDIIYSQGSAVLSTVAEVPAVHLKDLQEQCSQKVLSSGQCYEAFKAMGLEYGPGHRGIEAVYIGQGQVLAKLSLPSSVSATQKQFTLHPSLMDSALQASIGFMITANDAGGQASLKPVIPFALQELEILDNCTSARWAVLRYSDGSKAGDKVQKIDIDLCDDHGHVCVRMKGVSSRVLDGEASSVGAAEALGTLMLQPSWKEHAIAPEATAHVYAQHVVVLCELGEVTREGIETHMNRVHCITLQSEQESIEERFRNYAVQTFEAIQNILKDKPVGQVLVQIVVSTQGEQQLFSGLSGLLKTAQLENPKLIGQLIEVESGEEIKGIVEKLQENSRNPIGNYIRYQDNKRYVAGWSEVEASQEVGIPWKDQGVYLITGGAGGLGYIFAREIAHKVKDVTLILTGRSPLNASRQAQIKELEALGARTEYRQVDVTQKQAVADLIKNIQANFGNLHGIIHSAGVIKDNFILKKSREEMQAVLAPKVTGLVNLDEATKDLPLEFFILFSSGAGAMGNIGQADYSTANAFMDAYARYRNGRVASKQRHGQTLSINWPLWKEGGMHVDGDTEKELMQNMGLIAMQTPTGIRTLYQGFATGKDQVMVMEGYVGQLRQSIGLDPIDFNKFDNSLIEDEIAYLSDAFLHNLVEEMSQGGLSEEQFANVIMMRRGG